MPAFSYPLSPLDLQCWKQKTKMLRVLFRKAHLIKNLVCLPSLLLGFSFRLFTYSTKEEKEKRKKQVRTNQKGPRKPVSAFYRAAFSSLRPYA